MKNRIKLELSIFGDDFSPNDLTEELQIKPTSSWLKGDVFKTFKKESKRQECSWNYSTGYLKTLDFDESLQVLLEVLGDKSKYLGEYARKHSLATKFFIVLEMSEEQTPAFYLNRTFLEFVNELRAEIDVDMYIV